MPAEHSLTLNSCPLTAAFLALIFDCPSQTAANARDIERILSTARPSVPMAAGRSHALMANTLQTMSPVGVRHTVGVRHAVGVRHVVYGSRMTYDVSAVNPRPHYVLGGLILRFVDQGAWRLPGGKAPATYRQAPHRAICDNPDRRRGQQSYLACPRP